jgi:iron complex transport system substrate-binding protein
MARAADRSSLRPVGRPARLAALLLALLPVPAAAQEPLPRVMSLNVCTDQLVLALADPAQILSLSALADDADLSFHAATAAAYPKNRGLAEEVFLVRPDVVVTGTYSLHNTTPLLRHVGARVETFDYAQTLESVPGAMGGILGQEARAEAIAAAYEAELAALASKPSADAPTAIVYEQNGVVLGAGTLADSVLKAAGFRNLAAEGGYEGMAPYPLELLVRDRPDLVLLGSPFPGAPSLADQFVEHPAIASLKSLRRKGIAPRGSWSCAGPFTVEAVRALKALREEMAAAKGAAG